MGVLLLMGELNFKDLLPWAMVLANTYGQGSVPNALQVQRDDKEQDIFSFALPADKPHVTGRALKRHLQLIQSLAVA